MISVISAVAAHLGDTISVDIVTSDLSSPIGGVQFIITYNPAVLTYLDYTTEAG